MSAHYSALVQAFQYSSSGTLFVWSKLSPVNEMMWSWKCFPHQRASCVTVSSFEVSSVITLTTTVSYTYAAVTNLMFIFRAAFNTQACLLAFTLESYLHSPLVSYTTY
jgi:hypothetical protein